MHLLRISYLRFGFTLKSNAMQHIKQYQLQKIQLHNDVKFDLTYNVLWHH